MSYEYANARIRALRSRLLRARELEALAALSSPGELAAALARTDYGPDLERARQGLGGVAMLDEAVRRNLSRRLRGLLGFFEAERRGSASPSQPRMLVGILLARYELQNLVAALRGKAAGASAQEVLATLLPAGELGEERLAALAEAADVAACVDLAGRWGLPWAPALAAALPASRADRCLPRLELALRRAFLEWAEARLRGGGPNARLVRQALALEVDATNVLATLRLLRRGPRPNAEQLAAMLLPGGDLPPARVAGLLALPGPMEAVAALGRTSLGRALAGGATLAAELEQGVALEWAVERHLARWARAQLFRDPLGIAVALCYHAEKVVEARTLRLIARGRQGDVRHALAEVRSWPAGPGEGVPRAPAER